MPVLGLSVVLTEVKVDAYATGGTTDHLTPCRTSARQPRDLSRPGRLGAPPWQAGTYPTPVTGSHVNRTNADRVP